MKILVLGATGMAGHTISLYLQERGHDVTGFDIHDVPFINCITGNAKNTESLKNLLENEKYDTVINCIGILNKAADENQADAVFLNSYLPHFLADSTRNMETQVIQMSTDCVFSGKSGGYAETSLCDGESFYDRTKALGELQDEKNLTLRNSIVGPDINNNGIGLFNWFLAQKGSIKGYTKVMWTGLTTLQLAKIMEQAALEKAHGLYNMVPDQNISKYELLKLFNHYFRNDEIEIIPYNGFAADKTLIRTKYDFIKKIPDYETMVAEMYEWTLSHKNLYPHYSL